MHNYNEAREQAKDELEVTATRAVDDLFYVVNKMGTGEEVLVKVFVEKMYREHRTLLQSFWRVMFQVIKAYATCPSDLRNEDSVKWAKDVVECVPSYMRYI